MTRAQLLARLIALNDQIPLDGASNVMAVKVVLSTTIGAIYTNDNAIVELARLASDFSRKELARIERLQKGS